MRWLIELSVRRPVAVAMFYCALALLAWAAWVNLPIDVVPQGEFPKVTVRTGWPGASPESIQSLITSKIEAVAVTIPGVRKVSSRSARGSSTVIVEFGEDAKLDLARFELGDRLSLLQEDLPPSAGVPTIRLDLPREFQDLQGGTFLAFTLRAPRTLNALRQFAKETVVPALIAVDGISEVSVSGGQDPHLQVTWTQIVYSCTESRPGRYTRPSGSSTWSCRWARCRCQARRMCSGSIIISRISGRCERSRSARSATG